MARKLAWRILISSISGASASPTPMAAQSGNRTNSSFRFWAKFFESSSPSNNRSGKFTGIQDNSTSYDRTRPGSTARLVHARDQMKAPIPSASLQIKIRHVYRPLHFRLPQSQDDLFRLGNEVKRKLGDDATKGQRRSTKAVLRSKISRCIFHPSGE